MPPARRGESAISVSGGAFNWGTDSKKGNRPAFKRVWKELSKSEKSTAGKLGMSDSEWDSMVKKNMVTNPFHLSGINMDIKAGQTVAVVGSVGVGKSSLLAAILGEMEMAGRSPVVRAGTVAYAAQTAFIVNGCPPGPRISTPAWVFLCELAC